MRSVELVTIEKVGKHYKATLWGDKLVKLASAAGPSPGAALRNAEGVHRRSEQR